MLLSGIHIKYFFTLPKTNLLDLYNKNHMLVLGFIFIFEVMEYIYTSNAISHRKTKTYGQKKTKQKRVIYGFG